MLLSISAIVLWWRRRPEGILGGPPSGGSAKKPVAVVDLEYDETRLKDNYRGSSDYGEGPCTRRCRDRSEPFDPDRIKRSCRCGRTLCCARPENAQPNTLSMALCLPMSSRSTISSPRASKSAAACSPLVRPKIACAPRSFSGNWQSVSGSNRDAGFGRCRPRRRTSAIEALPQTPQAAPAENLRATFCLPSCAPRLKRTRTIFARAKERPESSPERNDNKCSRRAMMPSVKRNPATSSRSFPGVRKVTPSERRPTRISSGSSPARQSSTPMHDAVFPFGEPASDQDCPCVAALTMTSRTYYSGRTRIVFGFHWSAGEATTRLSSGKSTRPRQTCSK